MKQIKIDVSTLSPGQTISVCNLMKNNFERQYAYNPESRSYPRQIERCRLLACGEEETIHMTVDQFDFLSKDSFFREVMASAVITSGEKVTDKAHIKDKYDQKIFLNGRVWVSYDNIGIIKAKLHKFNDKSVGLTFEDGTTGTLSKEYLYRLIKR